MIARQIQTPKKIPLNDYLFILDASVIILLDSSIKCLVYKISGSNEKQSQTLCHFDLTGVYCVMQIKQQKATNLHI